MPLYHSLFFRLNLFFFSALIILGVLYVYVDRFESSETSRQIVQRSMEAGRLIHFKRMNQGLTWEQLASDAAFEYMADIPHDAHHDLKLNAMLPPRRHHEILFDGTAFYYKFARHSHFIVFKDLRDYQRSHVTDVLFMVLFSGLILLYMTLRNSLMPLRSLVVKIRKFAEGDLDVDTRSDMKDEIALISNEFHDAVSEVRKLQSTRQLFWRNIMHELRTPLTKGKLSLAMMPDNEQTAYIDTIFNRMDQLISQMADIEKLETTLEKVRIPMNTLVRNALENLYIDDEAQKVSIDEVPDSYCMVDEKLFVSALTNLIDNALKYAARFPIVISISPSELRIFNEGPPMLHSFVTSKTAFVSSNNGGLGLGLYITDAIITEHGFILDYDYTDARHCFIIRFK
jgi:two-component system OmpR family sensor kinase